MLIILLLIKFIEIKCMLVFKHIHIIMVEKNRNDVVLFKRENKSNFIVPFLFTIIIYLRLIIGKHVIFDQPNIT